MDQEELTLFRDMARRAFEQEISPHIEAWEELDISTSSFELVIKQAKHQFYSLETILHE